MHTFVWQRLTSKRSTSKCKQEKGLKLNKDGVKINEIVVHTQPDNDGKRLSEMVSVHLLSSWPYCWL